LVCRCIRCEGLALGLHPGQKCWSVLCFAARGNATAHCALTRVRPPVAPPSSPVHSLSSLSLSVSTHTDATQMWDSTLLTPSLLCRPVCARATSASPWTLRHRDMRDTSRLSASSLAWHIVWVRGLGFRCQRLLSRGTQSAPAAAACQRARSPRKERKRSTCTGGVKEEEEEEEEEEGLYRGQVSRKV